MLNNTLKNFLLFCGLEKEEFNLTLPFIWKRNIRILRITSLMACCMGVLFLILNIIMRSGIWLPYLFLFIGSLLILAVLMIIRRNPTNDKWSLLLCYAQMILVCTYASILSTQTSNYAIPATSVIVFIAVLPQSIDDRPIRMYAVMLLESLAYLVVSRYAKSPEIFSLDLMNVLTFCVVGIAIYSVICTRNVREIYQSIRIEKIQRGIISTLATVVEERDQSTGDHINRTVDYMEKLVGGMKKMEKYDSVSDNFYDSVILAAPMHDIGKIRIPDNILNKPGRLTNQEYEIMKKHSDYGAEIIQKAMKDVEDAAYCDIACNIARYHHERFDGTGYPSGLTGEDIPLEARMMALADVYDALVSERVYKKPYSKSKAREIIREGSGTQFDPDLAAIFLSCIN